MFEFEWWWVIITSKGQFLAATLVINSHNIVLINAAMVRQQDNYVHTNAYITLCLLALCIAFPGIRKCSIFPYKGWFIFIVVVNEDLIRGILSLHSTYKAVLQRALKENAHKCKTRKQTVSHHIHSFWHTHSFDFGCNLC